jgi:hypothetical protein
MNNAKIPSDSNKIQQNPAMPMMINNVGESFSTID